MKAENDAEPKAWQPSGVAEFMSNHEATPNSTGDLFRISLKQLDIIKDAVEHADFSQRGDLRPGDPEERLQLWLARQLIERAGGMYTVERESEADRKKKPDIRIRRPSLDPVTIEIKWAHFSHWSFTELEKALHEQLIGQYMKGNNSRHGVLVLATHDANRQWQPPGGAKINFSQLVDMLRQQAEEVLKTRIDIDGLEVIGIDFT